MNAKVRLSCTPLQHVSGRTGFDSWHLLWAAWVVDDLHTHKKLYFVGDTECHMVHDREDEDKVLVCLMFAEVGEHFGGVDVALLPIGYRMTDFWQRACCTTRSQSRGIVGSSTIIPMTLSPVFTHYDQKIVRGESFFLCLS